MPRLPRRRTAISPEPVAPITSTGITQAWKLLEVVSLLVRASEAKSTAALAADGLVAGVLYNVIKDEGDLGRASTVATLCCLTSVVLSGFCVAMSLIPRFWVRGTPQNIIYFNYIAKRYANCDDYLDAFRVAILDEQELVEQIGAQTWANAKIARRKFLWSGWAIILLFTSLIFLVATVFLAKF